MTQVFVLMYITYGGFALDKNPKVLGVYKTEEDAKLMLRRSIFMHFDDMGEQYTSLQNIIEHKRISFRKLYGDYIWKSGRNEWRITKSTYET